MIGRTGPNRDMLAKRLKNASSGPKIIDGRRINAFGICAKTPASPAAFDCAYSLAASASAPMADTCTIVVMPSPAAMRALSLHSLKGVFACFSQNAHAIHHRISALGDGRNTRIIADVTEHRLHLADNTVGADKASLLRIAHSNPHTPTRLGHTQRNIASNKTGTAENGNELRHEAGLSISQAVFTRDRLHKQDERDALLQANRHVLKRLRHRLIKTTRIALTAPTLILLVSVWTWRFESSSGHQKSRYFPYFIQQEWWIR